MRKAAAGRIDREVLEYAEGDLIDAVFRQVLLQIDDAADLCLVGQRRTGIDRFAFQPPAGVEFLERNSPRVDFRVALGAATLIAMVLESLAQREVLRLFLEGRHVRRGIVRRFGDDPASQPGPSLHRVRLATVREPRHDRRLREHAPQFAPIVRDRHELKAALRAVGEIVIAGDDLVGDQEIRLDQVPRPARLLRIKYWTNCTGSCRSCVARVASEFREATAIWFEHLEFVERQPLRR